MGGQAAAMAFSDLVKTALREVLRDELPDLLAELGGAARNHDAERLVGVEEAARRLGLATSTVYKRAEKCELASVKIGGRILFRPTDLDAFTEARRRTLERVQELAHPS